MLDFVVDFEGRGGLLGVVGGGRVAAGRVSVFLAGRSVLGTRWEV